MKSTWEGMINKCAATTEPHFMSGDQKILHNQSLTFKAPSSDDPFEDDFFKRDLILTELGYGVGGNKLSSLKRHYLNPEAIEKAALLVKDRVNGGKYGSAGFPLTGEVKTWTKQDFCMQAATVTFYPKDGLRVMVFYRTTELIKKFGADLVFLRKTVLRPFRKLAPIKQVQFCFSNVTVHPMFFPIYLANVEDPVKTLKLLRGFQPVFHDRHVMKWLVKYILEGESSWVQKFSQARQVYNAYKGLCHPEQQRKLKEYVSEHQSNHKP